jgi:excisionase family DNA binding protein
MTNNEKELGRTVSVNQACELLKVSRRTIYNWMGANKVQFVRTVGGSPRLILSSLYMEGNVKVEDVGNGTGDH